MTNQIIISEINGVNEENFFINAGDNRYLSDVIKSYNATDLPDNIILNKVTTGSGMTSVILQAPRKYVLCVPFVSLIQNKETWCDKNNIDYLSVYGSDVKERHIQEYTGDKIMVTYDSLPKVVKALEERGDIKEWKVAIDECHKLVDSGAFRAGAVRGVVANYKKFGAFLFGTATPVKDEYQLPSLKEIQKVNVRWNNLQPVSVSYGQYEKDLDKVVATVCADFIEGRREGNAHFFINSVKMILSIIKYLKNYDEANFNIVCSDNDRNEELIEMFNKKQGSKFYISKVGKNVRKINFYTATAFEGSDIEDENGHTFIVTDGSRDHTKIDIMTVLPQICGRLRNAINKAKIHLLYTQNQYYSFVSEAEFSTKVKETIKKKTSVVNTFKYAKENQDEETCQVLLKGISDDAYLLEEDGNLIINESAWYNEMHCFASLHTIYYVNKDKKKSGIKDGAKNVNGIRYDYKSTDAVTITELVKSNLSIRTKFNELCKEYFNADEDVRNRIALVEPIIKEAFDALGQDKMEALELRKTEIQKELIKLNAIRSNDWKIVSMLKYNIGQLLEKNKIKEKLQEIYVTLGIDKKAKATDISQWYEVKEVDIWNKELKKSEKKVTILSNKIKIK